MARDLYITEDKNKHPLLRRILILALLLTLAAGLMTGLYIIYTQQQVERTTQLYEQALSDADYETAADIYRQAQDRALSPGPLAQQEERNKQVLQQIEQMTVERIGGVLEKIRRGQRLTEDDLAFIEDMEEVTAVHVVQAVRRLAADFVAGDVHQQALRNAFSQLADLGNLRPAIGDLPEQLEAMEEASPQISRARQYVSEGEYWLARDLFLDVLANEELAGFVHEQTSLWLEDCEEVMFEPLLEQAYILMEGGRYISAVEKLERLQAVYVQDTDIQAALQESRRYVPELVRTNLPPEFLTIRPLIVDTYRAFDGDAYAQTADEAMITVAEFRALLQALYENDYILIDSNILYDENRKTQQLYVPEGKKPLVLLIDGLNYYASRRETGNAWDLVLDEEGQVSAVYPDERGNLITDREGEMIGILDLFVKDHPDFSLNGAKGTVSLTGYESLFGKVVDVHQLAFRNQALLDNNHSPEILSDEEITANREEAEAIIQRLKDTGWVFASATYGYINVSNHSLERVKDDTEKWLDRVGSLTGPVSMMIYPNGSSVINLDERAIYLREQGFILFGGQGPSPFYYVTEHEHDKNAYIHVDMTPVSGFTLRNSSAYDLERLFDVSAVYDAENRPAR